MERDVFWDIEKITMYLGFAIVGLGFFNATGAATISTALVTGISASGLCLALADYLSKKYDNWNNKFLLFIDGLLYILATMSILVYPNSKFITSLDKDTLDSLSTTASLLALGFVYVTIGFSNKKAILIRERKRLEDEYKRFEDIQEIIKNNQIISQKEAEQHEKIMELLEGMHKKNEDLERRIDELKRNAEKSSV
ncbi:hypothetical protein RE433_29145 (plasmid) [Bacillus cereus]|uniref:hypothetical protein n=1 Tax=Bacillus cereus TaxID=1396 RepID=UPI002867C15D|nr:hypothetical protein [Bacillus cereus]WMW41402.1 hypothetical protein RE433_29145 [Bacillus cereus]